MYKLFTKLKGTFGSKFLSSRVTDLWDGLDESTVSFTLNSMRKIGYKNLRKCMGAIIIFSAIFFIFLQLYLSNSHTKYVKQQVIHALQHWYNIQILKNV